MTNSIKSQIEKILKKAGISGDIQLSTPPNPEMGDFAFGCFDRVKKEGKNPNEAALEIASKIKKQKTKIVLDVKAVGPYVNFFLDGQVLAEMVLKNIEKEGKKYGAHAMGKKKKVLVEFGCPNPLKTFHLGHLKNLITGESVVRVFENAGYDVVRVNYQGDVGMHVAKALWGFEDLRLKIEDLEKRPLDERVKILGKAYAHGATAYEEDEQAKKEILSYNEKVYERDPSIQDVYQTTRQWSLEYFDTIYKKLGSWFDHMYFESETFERGVEIVEKFLKEDVFKKSEGAIIFEGSKYGLHDRVFINSKGYPTYEAKELALAEMRYRQYHPDAIIHVVGKEQTEYFKVVFKALEFVLPESKGKGYHLVGGYLQLKGQKKMSSRTGNVISGDELLDRVEARVHEIMWESAVTDKENVVCKVTNAVLKYAMLKSDVSKDVAFDMEASVSTSGDSGPYLLYIVARINSILTKAKSEKRKAKKNIPDHLEKEEKELVLALANFPEKTKEALIAYDPSVIAKYIFDLAQLFNRFYEHCPVLQAEAESRAFRLRLLGATERVMTAGLALLGIESVDEM
jgi:arginyl-tRNA synthetase